MDNLDSNMPTYIEDVQKIKGLILKSRYQASQKANLELLTMYYQVGKYISLNSRSGKWGTGAVESISKQLQGELPKLSGFSPSNMKNMRVFFEEWESEFELNRQLVTADLVTDNDVASEASLYLESLDITKRQAFGRVGFTHHREILRVCKTLDERWYYIFRCADEFWTVATLKHHLKSNDYVTLGSMPNNFRLTMPDEETAKLAVRAFKSDYLLDFVDIKEPDDYSERDLENAVVEKIKKFIMTMGDGFCFIGNQHRLLVDEEEFFVDMLLYNRDLQCLVALELKKDKFRPADLGQLSFYLSALDKYVRKEGENKTIGILLCEDMNRTVVELAVQDYDKPMGVATYRLGTDIPEPYALLAPIINGVQQILLESKE